MNEEMVTLGAVAENSVEKSGPTGETFIYVDISSIDRDRKVISEPKALPTSSAPSRAKQVLHTGDVLVSMTRPNLNQVAMVTPEFHGAIGSTGFHVLRSQWAEPKFLFYLVQSNDFIDEMCKCVQGALYPAVRPRDISSFEFFLPSSLEQQRIVAAIDTHFSRLDEAVANLKRVKANCFGSS
jgi:type I restriction enzyme S subunit